MNIFKWMISSLILLSLTAGASELKVARIMDADSFEDQTSKELMGVENGQVLLFTATPSESLLIDCSEGSGSLAYALYAAADDSAQKSNFAFDSLAKCEAVRDMLRGEKARIGSESSISITLDFEALKIKNIHFSEGL